MQQVRYDNLFHPQFFGDAVGQLLQRTEGAEPAAECTAVPQQHGCSGKQPQDEHDRIHQEEVPTEFGQDGGEQGQRIHDRQLRLSVPADINQSKCQEYQAETVVPFFVTDNPVLEQEYQKQDGQCDADYDDLTLFRFPDLFPKLVGCAVVGTGLVGNAVAGIGSIGCGSRFYRCADFNGRCFRVIDIVTFRQFVIQVGSDECFVVYAQYALNHQL